MNIMKTNMLLLNNKIMKDNEGNTTTQAPVPSTTEPQTGMKALSFLGMQNLMANPKLAQELGVMDEKSAPYASNVAFQGKFGNVVENGAKKAKNKFAQYAPAALMATMLLASCGKDINVSQSQTVIVDMATMQASIDALREEIKANNEAQTERDKEILAVLQQALQALLQMQSMMQEETLTNQAFRELLLGKMDDASGQRTAILQAIMTLQNMSEQQAKDALNKILLAFEKHNISFQQAMAQIIELLTNIDQNVSDIKDMLAKHFEKYDADMAEIKVSINDIKNGQKEIIAEMKNFAEIASTTSNDIKNMSIDIKSIRDSINNGVKFDDSQIIELLKRINATQDMSTAQIVAKLDAFLANQEAMAADLSETNKLLTKLGFVVSNDVINAIGNLGDKLEGLSDINAKLNELIAAVKSLVTSFDLYAKYAEKAHGEEMAALDSIRADFKDIKDKLDILIQQGNKAENQRNLTNTYLEALQNQVVKISEQMGRIPTIEEFDAMLKAHDEANQEFYANLIKNAGLNPGDFSNIEELLKEIKAALIDFQGTTNGYLADILARIKAMDPSSPDYNAKLDRIIELMENFKFECNCQCDCDHNGSIHEGVIDIIG